MTSYLVDANVLIRYLETSDVRHAAARNAIEGLTSQGHTLHITGQSIIEFWAVASRPTNVNGFGWDFTRCHAAVLLLLTSFAFLPDTPAVFDEWRRLVVSYSVAGIQVHDARLVAVMNAHGTNSILTFNTRHFQCFAENEHISIVDPERL